MSKEEQFGPPPRPIAPRECACGCGHTFQPGRKDQIYYNKQHANFGYNHNDRKTKNRNQEKAEKTLRKNDGILERHYKSERKQDCVIRYYDVIKAEGFNFNNYVSMRSEDNRTYYFTYNYIYEHDLLNDIKIIKTYKR